MQLLFTNASPRQSSARNFLWRLASVVLQRGARFVVLFYAARLLGPTAFGEYNYLFAFAAMFFALSGWGMDTLVIRELKQQANPRQALAGVTIVKAAASFLSGLVAIGAIFIFHLEHAFLLIFLLCAIIIVTNVQEILANVFTTSAKNEQEFLCAATDSAIVLTGFAFWFYPAPSLLRLIILFLTASLGTLISTTLLAQRLMPLSLGQLQWGGVWRYVRIGAPLTLLGLAEIGFFSLGQVLLKKYVGLDAVGQFSAALKVILIASLVPSLLASVLYPYIAERWNDSAGTRRLLRLALLAVGGTAVMTAAGVMLLGPWAIRHFLGSSYAPASIFLMYLAPILICMGLSVLFGYVLISHKREATSVRITLSVAAITAILYYLCIIRFGVWGAVLAAAVGQFLQFAVTYGYVRYVLKGGGSPLQSESSVGI